jgi:predicted RNA-binding protein with PUA-like domain
MVLEATVSPYPQAANRVTGTLTLPSSAPQSAETPHIERIPAMATGYWLMKSEPTTFSIDDLKNSPGSADHWDGVRNYQARNFMRDDMKRGDRALFYHSGKHPSVVGTMTVLGKGYPDYTAQDPSGDHYDPKSTPDNPIWYMVDVRFDEAFSRPVPLKALREVPALADMLLLKRGNRLSVMPIAKDAFAIISKMGRKGA